MTPQITVALQWKEQGSPARKLKFKLRLCCFLLVLLRENLRIALVPQLTSVYGEENHAWFRGLGRVK